MHKNRVNWIRYAPLLALLIALPVALIATAKPADNPVWEEAMPVSKAEIKAAMQAAGIYSRYKMPFFARPEVYVVPDKVLQKYECGGRECSIAGVTLWKNPHRIYLSASMAANERPYILVHEIVHWLQFRAGWAGDPNNCPDIVAHEVEAYEVQHLYRILGRHENSLFWMPAYRCPGATQ